MYDEQLFMMSKRFDKMTPEDFGLMLQEEATGTYVLPTDRSLWKRRQLYDFGWGSEMGYYRIPLPGFDHLIKLVLSSSVWENRYGAAAILLEDYPEPLLVECEKLIADDHFVQQNREFFKILGLDEPINRSRVVGKTHSDVLCDYKRWEAISRRLSTQSK